MDEKMNFWASFTDVFFFLQGTFLWAKHFVIECQEVDTAVQEINVCLQECVMQTLPVSSLLLRGPLFKST